jgi:hypothetical protein
LRDRAIYSIIRRQKTRPAQEHDPEKRVPVFA